MNLSKILGKQLVLAGISIVACTCIPQFAPAAIPSGQWRVDISDSTNRVWDISKIAPLQSPTVEFYDEATTVSFDAPFSQTASGKLTGAGTTDVEVMSSIITGTVPGTYVAKGSIHSAKGIARVNFSSTVKGTAMIEGQPRAISSSSAVKVVLDSLTESATGIYTSTASAAGYGTLKETGLLEISWQEDLIAAMGDGSWTLHMSLTNDAVKKVGGTATVDLSGGRTLGFTVKGNYNVRTDITILILSADAESKGSSLKVGLLGTDLAVLQGKLTGQAIRAIGTPVPE